MLKIAGLIVVAIVVAVIAITNAPAGNAEKAASTKIEKAEKATPDTNAFATPPEWYMDELAFLTRDGGKWDADNSAFKSESEDFDQYIVEWRLGLDGKTMSGRLYAQIDGAPTRDFWEFRQYWHPGKKAVILEQFGNGGTYGVGQMWLEPDGSTKVDQEYFWSDGSLTRNGHVTTRPDENTHVTTSYAIVDGEWKANRTYRWKRNISPDSRPAPAKD